MYRVPEANLGRLEALLEKLARRARRLGLTPVTFARRGFDVAKDYNGDPIRIVLLDVVGEAPVLAGWSFLATIDHTGEAGNIVRAVPGATIPDAFRAAPPTCDHCQTDRRRNETFVLRHEGGEFKRVGRSCLASFLGGIDPKLAAEAAQMLALAASAASDCEEYDERGPRVEKTYWAIDVLTAAAHMVLIHGWVSSKAAGEKGVDSTAERVRKAIFSGFPVGGTPEARDLAAKALAWVEEEIAPKDVKSDYEHNLATVLAVPALRSKEFGIAVSAVGVYQQAQARKAQQASGSNEFVGQPGDKLSGLELTLLATRHIHGAFGASTLLMFRDAAGRGFKWFASNPPDLREGATYTVAAVVKKHEEFKGRKETVLTRCVVR